MVEKIKNVCKKLLSRKKNTAKTIAANYYNRFEKYSFVDCACKSEAQYRASITRLYHTIEKGLSYENYRAGFGRENVEKLLTSMEQYAAKYDVSAFFYQTALCCLNCYLEKNKQHGMEDAQLEKRIRALAGTANEAGGTIWVEKPKAEAQDYAQLMTSRHSIRHFSSEPVDVQTLKKAVRLAQYTPSACNRQGWKTRIVADKDLIAKILANQNGNRGFGQEFDKLLIITADLQAFQRSRETFQAFVDGGMYAESVLNALYYYGVGSVPLSGALNSLQAKTVKQLTQIADSEEIILFIGVGNYPDGGTLTTRSERFDTEIPVL